MKLTKEVKEFLKPDTTISAFCVRAGISRSTFVRRMKYPENFTAIEIKVLKEMSNLTEDQIFEK